MADGIAFSNTLVNGLGGEQGYGETILPPNDDESYNFEIADIFEEGLNFFGNTYTNLWVNNNGNLSFGEPLAEYIPSAITGTAEVPIIAAFWGDVDTLPADLESGRVYFDKDLDSDTITITWAGVNRFSVDGTFQNYFQIQLVDAGGGDFDIIYRYEDIQWITSESPGTARAGYTANDGEHYFEVPGSGTDAMLDLETTTGNTGVAGVWRFEVRSGEVNLDPTQVGPQGVLADGTEDTDYLVTMAQLTEGFADPEGGALTVHDIVASNATVTIIDAETARITPDADYNGPIVLNYSIADDQDSRVAATHSFMVAAVNDAPSGSASAVLGHALENSAFAISTTDLLEGFSDVDGDALSIVGLSADHGTVAESDDGFVVTPDAGYTGTVVLSYTVADATGASAAGTQSYIVDPARQALNGTSGHDILEGALGQDTIQAGRGNDLLIGWGGDDSLHGGDDHDTLRGEDGNDSLSGGTGSDSLNGGTGNDTLNGGARWDTLVGGAGDDSLDGGLGNDQMFGLGGDDTYIVDDIGDRVYEVFDDGIDTVKTSIDYALTQNVENLYLIQGADLMAIGNGLSNVMHGNTNNNTLSGGLGNDSLYGWEGNDYLAGGDDHDRLSGGAGNDTLAGGRGNDVLGGGAGADDFVFAAVAVNGHDHVVDFESGQDRLVFTASDYGFASGHVLTAAQFTTGTAAAGATAQFVWDAVAGKLWWDADGDGAGQAFEIALISGGATVIGEDLAFV